MRAIIIEDKDSQQLLRDLQFNKMVADNVTRSDNLLNKPEGWTEDIWRKSVVDSLHRSFHFVVCRWLQDQGCNVIRS